MPACPPLALGLPDSEPGRRYIFLVLSAQLFWDSVKDILKKSYIDECIWGTELWGGFFPPNLKARMRNASSLSIQVVQEARHD